MPGRADLRSWLGASDDCLILSCRNCLVMYHNRAALIHHLKHLQTGCLISLIQSVEPLTSEAQQELDSADAVTAQQEASALRQKHFRFPPARVSGPLRPPLWKLLQLQTLPVGSEVADHSLAEWLHTAWILLQESDLSDLLDHLRLLPCTQLRLRALLAFLGSQLQALPALSRIAATLHLNSALALWVVPLSDYSSSLGGTSWRSVLDRRDWTLLAAIRVPAHLSRLSTAQPGIPWTKLRQPFQVVFQMKQQHTRDLQVRLVWPALRALPGCKTIVLAHLFLGKRRPGDFMEWALRWGSVFGCEVKVILIDLAFSEHRNMLDPEKFELLIKRVRSREISGLLMFYSKDTWCVGRSRPAPDNTSHWRRVIRESNVPRCKPGLTAAELKQLWTANRLLFVALLLAVECIFAGTSFILEHPAEPSGDQRDLPSIWKTWPLLWLMQCQKVKRHLVFQSDYGAQSRMPTHFNFLTGWISNYERIFAAETAPSEESQLRCLKGRDDGVMTRQAKEYLSFLNRALALYDSVRQLADNSS